MNGGIGSESAMRIIYEMVGLEETLQVDEHDAHDGFGIR